MDQNHNTHSQVNSLSHENNNKCLKHMGNSRKKLNVNFKITMIGKSFVNYLE